MARNIGKTESGKQMLGYDLQDVDVISKGLDLSDFQIEMVATTEAIDRDQEVISIDGWDFKNYKKNPVILANHNYWAPAIGKAASVKIQDKKMVLRIEFPEEGVNPEADVYRKLYKSGFMKAGSIGFLPRKWEYGDGGKSAPYYRKFVEQEMLEFSLVTVPSNPEALINGEKGFRDAMKSGVISSSDYDLIVKAIYEAVETPFKKDVGIFVPSKFIKEESQDDGHDEDQQQGDPGSSGDEAGEEAPKAQEIPGDQGKAAAEGGEMTKAEQLYHGKLNEAITGYIKSDDGRALIKEVLKEEVKLLSDKGMSDEAVKHYSEVLFGAEADEPESDSKEQDDLDAVLKAVKDGLKTKGAN